MDVRDPAGRSTSGEPQESEGAETERCTWDILDELACDAEVGWERLIRRFESRLRVLLHFRMSPKLREVLDEEDVLQEVWTEVARNLERFEYRGVGSFQRWVAGILANKLLHAGRDARRLPLTCEPTAIFAGRRFEIARPFRAEPTSVSGRARRGELEERVRAVLLRLPETERETVLLKVFEGLSGREVARRLNVDESTVSTRFKRALELCTIQLREFAP